MKKFKVEDDINDVVFQFISKVNRDPKIKSLVKQLRKRYNELETQTGFADVMKDDESFEFMQDYMADHTDDVRLMDIVTYLWYTE